MGSVDRVITLGGVGGGRKPETGIIYIYICMYVCKVNDYDYIIQKLWDDHLGHLGAIGLQL